MWNDISKRDIFIALALLIGLPLVVFLTGGTWIDMVTVFALVTGPALAVGIAKGMEDRRAKRERRMDIFRTLMRTRRASQRLSADHVSAINLVEVEFQDVPEVLRAWKAYYESLNQHNRTDGDRYELFANLLEMMSGALNYKIKGIEIFTGGYTPVAWEKEETTAKEWETIRHYLIALANYKKELPVAVNKMPDPNSAKE